MKLLSYLHDPDNLYVPLLENADIPQEIEGTVVAVSEETTDRVISMVDNLGFKIVKGGSYGTARLNSLKSSLNGGTDEDEFFFVCDFDKLLHWLEKDREELLKVLNSTPKNDVTVVGRSIRALSTYPETWVETEDIAIRVLAKIIKKKVDFMNGPVILSRQAAQIIADNGIETEVGSCVEFCLLPFQAGMTINSIEIDGLTWEDPDRYTKLIEEFDSFDDWKYDTYHSLYEWRKRVDFLNKQVKTMIRLTEEPVNPKFPIVHNKTYELD